jgi:hypothetical protein
MNKIHHILGFVLYFITSDARKNHRKIDSKPHIILILADDLGWNEVSWHNNRIKTPYMEVCRGLVYTYLGWNEVFWDNRGIKTRVGVYLRWNKVP